MALLGMPYSNAMPLVPGRTFALSIPGAPDARSASLGGRGIRTNIHGRTTDRGDRTGRYAVGWVRPSHDPHSGQPGWEDGNYFYNGVRLEDVDTPRGLKKNGTEKAGGFFTRGILIDVAALKGVERLPKGYAITVADYQAALQKQGTGEATKGDVVLLRTGWNSLWKTNHLGRPVGEKVKTDDQLAKNTAEFNSGEPGAAPELCDYLAAKKISMIGSDTWGLEALDFSKALPPGGFAYCHMNLVARRGSPTSKISIWMNCRATKRTSCSLRGPRSSW